MKKDYIQEILINLLARRKKRLEEDKIIKKNSKEMSLVERNNYEQIIERNNDSHFYIVKAPFVVVFYLGLFGLLMKYAFNIDILTTLKEPAILILGLFPLLLVVWLFVIIFQIIHLNNIKRKLLLKR